MPLWFRKYPSGLYGLFFEKNPLPKTFGLGMRKILVVDDEENIRLLYKEELEDDGYQMYLASSAEDAMKKVDEEKPDIITLDIKMPGMDGIEFLRILKEEKKQSYQV